MCNIFLIGYMAAGKTTLGKSLTACLNIEFIDLDHYIEQQCNASVSEIFAQHGEQWFRELESHSLRTLGSANGRLIACGGGTPCFYNNMQYMNENGITIYLQASVNTLFARLAADRDKRPVLANKTDNELRTFIEQSLAERLPFYTQAKHILDANSLEDEHEITETMLKVLDFL